MEIAVIFIFGLIVGSFLNALIWRLYSGDSIFEKSSKCPRCGHKLSWPDLVPVVSFFALRGQCRYCKKPISWQYPLVELATAFAFVLIYGRLSIIDYRLLFQFVFVSFLIIIFAYYFKHYLILDKVVFPAAVLALVYQIWQHNVSDAIYGALILSGFFAVLYFISRGRWIGAGDVKLGIFLGFLIPFPETLALFFMAYFLGAGISILLVLLKNKKFSDKVPFGTFLTCAAFFAMLKGEEIISWYFKLIGVR